MATHDVLRDQYLMSSHSLLDLPRGENAKSRGLFIEKKIEILESLNGKVSNRRSRRWLNDRLLMELVPRLDADEIRGLFAPPPFGDSVPPSAFSMTNGGDWDKFRNIDMDKEAGIIDALKGSCPRKTSCSNAEKVAALNAWHRVGCKTREAFRRSFLSELIEGYEERIRSFIVETDENAVLVIRVQDPFQRLLLHGVCEFYDLVSLTDSESDGIVTSKMTKIKKKKKNMGCVDLPNITLSQFLAMSKEGLW